MRKLYSIVLMATALLIGTNVWAQTHVAQIVGGGSYETLKDAFNAAQDGQTIKMLKDYTMVEQVKSGKKITTPAEIIVLGLGEGTAKNITLDFAGNTVTSKNDKMIQLYSGTLNLVNSNPEKGGGLHNTNTSKHRTIWVYGSILKNCDPSKPNSDLNPYYTHLTIGEGVNIVSDGYTAASANASSNDKGGICVMVHRTGDGVFNGINGKGAQIYGTDRIKGDPRGVANGVRIDVSGTLQGSLYAIQTNGEVACPDEYYRSFYDDNKETFYETSDVDMLPGDIDYSPYIYIHKSALLENVEVNDALLTGGQVALYTSGYARWYVEGTCNGTTGLYMKSGEVTLNDATITSTADVATAITNQTIGVNGGGNAIVVESNAHYSGNIGLNIEGDTKVETQAEGGTALFETIENESESEVEHITISGGTLTGEKAIVISDQTVEGGKVSVNGVVAEGDADFTGIVPNTAHTTIVGNTIIVSKGAGPTDDNTGDWDKIKGKEGQNVKWNVAENASIESDTITFGELQIIPASAGQTLTIANGSALVVDRLIMNDYARIIVKAGGKLIVNGTQGINAPVVDNIVLESSEASQALFLFNPAVSSNKTPNATVHMTVAKGVDGGEDVWTRFAIPVLKMPASGWIKKNSAETWLYGWDYENQEWATVTDGTITGNRAMKPWTGYSMSNNLETEEVYTFKNELVGNVNAGLNFVHEGYNFFGNSYSSYIDAKTILQGLTDNHVDGAIYMWNVNAQAYTSTSLYALGKSDIEAWQKDVAPMQTFILQLRGANEASQSINYGAAVWNNARYGYNASTNQAPRRQMVESNDDAYINMVVTAANGKSDRILFFENAANSDAYERGYDAAKYMNENTINFYATINGENYGNVVTDNLEGKEISLQTVDDVTYTITFKTVEGNEYALLDKETNRVTAIVAGNTYEFAAQPNSTIEGRFEIVGRHNMPTAIDNTEVKANVKGIYTLTGQFVGEDFNVLPAGVYVVNGVKIVK